MTQLKHTPGFIASKGFVTHPHFYVEQPYVDCFLVGVEDANSLPIPALLQGCATRSEVLSVINTVPFHSLLLFTKSPEIDFRRSTLVFWCCSSERHIRLPASTLGFKEVIEVDGVFNPTKLWKLTCSQDGQWVISEGDEKRTDETWANAFSAWLVWVIEAIEREAAQRKCNPPLAQSINSEKTAPPTLSISTLTNNESK